MKIGPIGFVVSLTIIFIILKWVGHIDWGWLWVLSPLWITAVISITSIIILSLMMFAVAYYNNSKK